MTFGRIKITAGFVFLWSILLYVEEGAIFVPVWTAALLHELGHLMAVYLCGGKISSCDLTAGGISIHLAQYPGLTYMKEIICVLAGPALSLISALIFCLINGIMRNTYIMIGMCMIQCVFNLLPSMGLDGGRALYLFFQMTENTRADVIIKVTTIITACFLAIGGAVVFWKTQYNVTFLFSGIYACVSSYGDGLFDSAKKETKMNKG